MHCASPNSIRARIFIVLALMCFMLYEILIINCKCKAFTHLEATPGFGKPRPKNSPLDYFYLLFVQACPFRILHFNFAPNKKAT